MLFCSVVTFVFPQSSVDAYNTSCVSIKDDGHSFVLSARGKPSPLFASDGDYPGVIRAVEDLQSDIGRVTNTEPRIYINKVPASKEIAQ